MGRYLITSALPYVNGVKHLGNLAGSMLPADIFARFHRLKGDEVMFVCATDEHGTPAELAAAAEGSDVRQYCDRQHRIQRDACNGFNLSFDWFGRSSSEQNHRLTRHFANRLEQAGLIREQESLQIYSTADKRFLPDRYVIGVCPHCRYDKARGDQCDGCGALLDPAELEHPHSAISGSDAIERRNTRHLFLLQSKMERKLRQWVDKADNWPILARSIARKWLDEGLRDRAITRDLIWGVPVSAPDEPRPGFEDKVFYVWFDAPIEYIAATAEWAHDNGQDDKAWQRWWRTDKGADDVIYVQFMGKDNVAFHTVSFPATLLGADEPWKLADQIKAFNWMTWHGGKFSTSEKRGLFMDQALQLLPADYWRWYLVANAPEGADSAFDWQDFQARINSDLANVLGNLVNRLTRYTANNFDGKIPADAAPPGKDEQNLLENAAAQLDHIETMLENMEFRKSAAAIRNLWAHGNEYLTKAAPWKNNATNPQRAQRAVVTGLNFIHICALVALPVIPDSAGKILDALGVDNKERVWPNAEDPKLLDKLRPGATIIAPDILFDKITDAQIAKWSNDYGDQTDPEQIDESTASTS